MKCSKRKVQQKDTMDTPGLLRSTCQAPCSVSVYHGTDEENTKKNVQMQSLAKKRHRKPLCSVNDVCKDEFGQPFVYTDIFMGKLELQEFVTVEKFIDGDFSKYINNTGTSSSTTQYVGIAQVISARKLNASLTILMRNLHSR